MSDYVILDLRDERGRFFCRPKLPAEMYVSLELLARLKGITFEELLHQAISDYANVHVVEPA